MVPEKINTKQFYLLFIPALLIQVYINLDFKSITLLIDILYFGPIIFTLILLISLLNFWGDYFTNIMMKKWSKEKSFRKTNNRFRKDCNDFGKVPYICLYVHWVFFALFLLASSIFSLNDNNYIININFIVIATLIVCILMVSLHLAFKIAIFTGKKYWEKIYGDYVLEKKH